MLWALGIAAWVVSLAAFVVILFTGRYPKSLFDFVVAYQRWNLRVMAYAGPFMGNFMVDKYPPFSFEEEPDDPVIFRVEYPESLSKLHAVLKLLLGWLYVGIPHGIILLFYGIALMIALFVVWFIILFTGRFPESVFRFAEGYMRWGTRGEPIPRIRHGQIPQVQPQPLDSQQKIDSKEKRRRTAPTLFLVPVCQRQPITGSSTTGRVKATCALSLKFQVLFDTKGLLTARG